MATRRTVLVAPIACLALAGCVEPPDPIGFAADQLTGDDNERPCDTAREMVNAVTRDLEAAAAGAGVAVAAKAAADAGKLADEASGEVRSALSELGDAFTQVVIASSEVDVPAVVSAMAAVDDAVRALATACGMQVEEP